MDQKVDRSNFGLILVKNRARLPGVSSFQKGSAPVPGAVAGVPPGTRVKSSLTTKAQRARRLKLGSTGNLPVVAGYQPGV
jgi:hypothetical protein